MFLNCNKNKHLTLFALIFYHEFNNTIQDIIGWLNKPYNSVSIDNAIADSISAVVDKIPMIGVLSQIADNAAGAFLSLHSKKKNALLFEQFGIHLYSPEIRLKFLKHVFNNEKTLVYIGFSRLACTNPATYKELVFSNHFLPEKHRWMQMISQEIINKFIKNIQQFTHSDIITLDISQLSNLFRQSVYNISSLFLDSKHQIKQIDHDYSRKLQTKFNCPHGTSQIYVDKTITKIQAAWRKYVGKQHAKKNAKKYLYNT